MATTITFHDNEQESGWSSRWSYDPESMVFMNNRFYTFDGGNLYLHDDNATRGSFYGTEYDSQVTGVFNMSPTEIKVWKTLEIEGNSAWDITMITDLMSGSISSDFFEQKEGTFFAFIRNSESAEVDFKARSVRGIGIYNSVNTGTPSAVVVTMPSSMRTIVTLGDSIYKIDGSTPVLCGVVTALGTDNEFTIDTTSGGSNPEITMPMLTVKSTVAESQGMRGYYMKYVMTTDSTGEVELFGVNSRLFKSYP